MTYEFLRNFSITWGLFYLFAAFIGVVLVVLRTKAKAEAEDAANIPFREDG